MPVASSSRAIADMPAVFGGVRFWVLGGMELHFFDLRQWFARAFSRAEKTRMSFPLGPSMPLSTGWIKIKHSLFLSLRQKNPRHSLTVAGGRSGGGKRPSRKLKAPGSEESGTL